MVLSFGDKLLAMLQVRKTRTEAYAMPPTKAPATNRTPARQTTQPARTRVPRPLAPAGGRFTMGKRSQGFTNFVRELRSEIRKVIWPTRKEATNLTGVVIALATGVGVFLGSIDFIFAEFFRFLLRATGAGGF